MKWALRDRAAAGRVSMAARKAALTGAALIAVLTMATAASAGEQATYLDPHRSVENRVDDLLGRMTLAEKIGQMVQIEVTQVTDTNNSCISQGGFNLPNPVCEQKIFI
jgi:hypothetical protein